MRVYVVHPGATFSTSDVYDGLVAGLHAHGVEVYEGRIDTILNWYDAAVSAAVKVGAFAPVAVDNAVLNRQRLASAHITQHILDVWPDLVLVVSGHNYHVQDVRALRRAGLRTACLLTEAPYFLDAELMLAACYDAVFTNERACVETFRAVTPRAHYLPHAYHPERHTPGAADPAYVCDAFFVGSWFEERRKLLLPLAEGGIDLVWKGHDLTTAPDALLPNAEAAAYYRAARISLNIHRTTTSAGSGEHIRVDDAESLNPRAYEIPACGGFMLCDDSRRELFDLFGDYAPTYRAGDAADLERQVRSWLKRPARRAETARAMRDAVQPHSWTARAGQLLEALL